MLYILYIILRTWLCDHTAYLVMRFYFILRMELRSSAEPAAVLRAYGRSRPSRASSQRRLVSPNVVPGVEQYYMSTLNKQESLSTHTSWTTSCCILETSFSLSLSLSLSRSLSLSLSLSRARALSFSLSLSLSLSVLVCVGARAHTNSLVRPYAYTHCSLVASGQGYPNPKPYAKP